jgi:hypothetical protein
METYAEWAESRLPLDMFLAVGDVVDEEMVNYFVSVMPPAYMSSWLIQIGEPNSHVEGKATFATISNSSPKGWVYNGNCYRGANHTVTPTPAAA